MQTLHIGMELGARVAIFGSPRARNRGHLSPAAANTIAQDFFGSVSEHIRGSGLKLCIEALPKSTCNFLNTTGDVFEFSQLLPAEAIGLHLDTASLTLAGENEWSLIATAAGRLSHVHASEIGYGPFGSSSIVKHDLIARSLCRTGYRHTVSAEMLAPSIGFDINHLVDALALAGDLYGIAVSRPPNRPNRVS
jgi:sugar phosphate isomerase/epimerase